jgi:hypothetical protein
MLRVAGLQEQSNSRIRAFCPRVLRSTGAVAASCNRSIRQRTTCCGLRMRGAFEVKNFAHFAIAIRFSRAGGTLCFILQSVTAMLFMRTSVRPNPRW